MEIKLDVTNPVMIQRAREQIEEAEKRAELIKSPGGKVETSQTPIGKPSCLFPPNFCVAGECRRYRKHLAADTEECPARS